MISPRFTLSSLFIVIATVAVVVTIAAQIKRNTYHTIDATRPVPQSPAVSR
jgi:hypothetical protein